MAIRSISIRPMVIYITVHIPTITIGGTDGTGIRTMAATIHSAHTTVAGTMDIIGMGIIGMDTTGTPINGTTTARTIISARDTPTLTCQQTACFQQQELEPLHAMSARPVQPMEASIRAMERTEAL